MLHFAIFNRNVEGELVNELQRVGFDQWTVLFLTLADILIPQLPLGMLLLRLKCPVIEVHISNVHAREDFRKLSLVSGKSVGSIFGLGLKGYDLAVEWFVDNGR